MRYFGQRMARGFSSIEIIVSVALFSMVVTLAVGALVAVIDANDKSRNLKSAMDSIEFTIEGMSRNLRVGGKFACAWTADYAITIYDDGTATYGDCPANPPPFPQEDTSGGKYLAYRNKDGKIAYYRFKDGCIQEKVTNIDWGTVTYSDDLANYSCLTGPQVNVTNARFYVFNSSDPTKQPRLIFVIQGTAGIRPKTQTSFSIMTSVSQRIPHFAQ